jgi:predicted ABC-type ATPase
MNIYIVAGPPGVGKSSSSYRFIPPKIPIIDHDLAGYKYKKEGFNDYKELGVLIGNEQIKEFLFQNKDFALELNLGFQSHYDYLRSIYNFDIKNKIHLILFFSDSLELCQLRAKIRFQKGGHLVEPSIVQEMYEQTFVLLNTNKHLFYSMNFIDVTNENIERITNGNTPKWIINSGLI